MSQIAAAAPVRSKVHREGRMALKYTAVSLLGFATDYLLLQAGTSLGLSPAAARIVSLVGAMHVTFLVNGLMVFGCLERHRAVRQWARYMASNGLGNVCNYWIYLAFVSARLPIVSEPVVALGAGGLAAWTINYASTRFLVFHKRTGARHAPWDQAESVICDD